MATDSELLEQLLDRIADRVLNKLAAAGSAPAPSPAPKPAPAPNQPAESFDFVKLSDGKEWVNGVSTIMQRFFLENTPAARNAAKAGRTARFAGGASRKVTKAEVAFGNILVHVDGNTKLSPSVGHPNKVTFEGAADPEPD